MNYENTQCDVLFASQHSYNTQKPSLAQPSLKQFPQN